jgi:hypothetical protein
MRKLPVIPAALLLCATNTVEAAEKRYVMELLCGFCGKLSNLNAGRPIADTASTQSSGRPKNTLL